MSSLLDLINQLITEHGSAEIQDKRITQVKEYATLLEKKFTLLEAETSILKVENETLKAENVNLQKDNAELKEKLKGYEKSAHNNLSKEQIDILKIITRDISLEDKIVDAAERNKEAVRFDLEELKEAGLIEIQLTCGFTFCNLTQDGRRYLKKLGFLT